MEANVVDTGLLQTVGNLLGMIMIREAGSAVTNDTEKLCGGSVFKYETIALTLAETMFSRRLLIFENE